MIKRTFESQAPTDRLANHMQMIKAIHIFRMIHNPAGNQWNKRYIKAGFSLSIIFSLIGWLPTVKSKNWKNKNSLYEQNMNRITFKIMNRDQENSVSRWNKLSSSDDSKSNQEGKTFGLSSRDFSVVKVGINYKKPMNCWQQFHKVSISQKKRKWKNTIINMRKLSKIYFWIILGNFN